MVVIPRPEVGRLANWAYEQMAPVAVGDAERGWPLLKFLHAYYIPLQKVDDIVRGIQGVPGWAVLLDPDVCPERYLPFCALFAGVRLTAGMTEADKRSRIKSRDGLNRCTPGAIRAAAAAHTLEPHKVILRERFNPDAPIGTDSPGYVEVITYTDETPDPVSAEAAVREQKDVGLLMSYRVIDGQDWAQVVANNATWADVVATYATWTDVIEDTPV